MLLALAVDRAADERRPQPAQDPRPARPLQHRPLGGDQLALVLAALEGILERPDDTHVRVARTLAAALLADLEEWIDPMVLGRLR